MQRLTIITITNGFIYVEGAKGERGFKGERGQSGEIIDYLFCNNTELRRVIK